MAGTVRGKIDCFSNNRNATSNSQEVFKAWFDFMEALKAAGVVQRIALQYGNGAIGTDYHDGVNPFGHNAFATYRFPPSGSRTKDFYLMGQWSNNTAFGSSPGSPGYIEGNTGSSGGKFGIAFASALESDGTTNASPWNGDISNDGGDTKGPVDAVESGPVWAAPAGGTLAVWPMSNADGNSHATDKQNTIEYVDLGSGNSENLRYGFVADDDNFFFYINQGDDLDSVWVYFGMIVPITGVTMKYPLALISESSDISYALSYGTTTGTSAREGGFFNDLTSSMDFTWFTILKEIHAYGTQPNQIGTTGHDELPLVVYMAGNAANRRGTVGTFDTFLRTLFHVIDLDAPSDLSRVAFGSITVDSYHITVPWDGTTRPRENYTRAGISF